ncbi:MAG: hypothetical protein KDJ52_21920, partial [Anaerolineae bacterium]|nr:hypothetical protein [Anaerolineae bacterium]
IPFFHKNASKIKEKYYFANLCFYTEIRMKPELFGYLFRHARMVLAGIQACRPHWMPAKLVLA